MADFIFAAAKKAVMVIQEYKKLKGQMSKCARATHTTLSLVHSTAHDLHCHGRASQWSHTVTRIIC